MRGILPYCRAFVNRNAISYACAMRRLLIDRTLLRAIARHTTDTRLVGMSAEIAFYQLFGFFPFLIVCCFLLGLFPQADLVTIARRLFAEISPEMVTRLVDRWFTRAYSAADYTLLSFSGLGIIWAGSSGIGSFIDAFTVINGRQGDLGIMRTALYRVFFTLAGTAALVLTLALWVIAPPLAAQLFASAGWAWGWQAAWFILRWPLALLLLLGGLALFYHALGRRSRPLPWSMPGAVIACALFALASRLFALYVSNLAVLSVSFGMISVVIVLMLWLQLLDLAILVGEICNCQFYRRFVLARHAAGQRPK